MLIKNIEVEGQISLFQAEKSKEEQLIENVLLRGSGFVDGKKRIREMFNSDLTRAERVKAISKEYGIGGSCVNGLWTDHDSKGIRFRLHEIDVFLTWSKVEKRIHGLIQEGRYKD